MQRLLRCSLILAGFLLAPGLSHAGVYNLSERPLWPLPVTFPQIKLILSELRNCPDPPKGFEPPPLSPASLRYSYIRQFEELDARRKTKSLLGTLDYIDLSGCLIRLGRISDDKTGAIALLEDYLKEMPPDDPARFMIYANLAMAYHVAGEGRRAIDYQAQALEAWPTVWAGWGPAQMDSYRRCERYFLTLLRSRNREDEAGKRGRFDSVDPLFPRVKFVGPNGQYEAGAIAARYDDELPLEAGPVLLQLLLWAPNDDRICWLWAEVLNARNAIAPAAEIMIDLVNNRRLSNITELLRHRQVLTSAYETNKAIDAAPGGPAHLASTLLWAMRPRSDLHTPVAGYLATEFASQAPLFLESYKAPVKEAQRALPDWRTMVVSFVAGCVVTVLLRMQINQWRRPAGTWTNSAETAPLTEQNAIESEPANAQESPEQPQAPV